MWVYDFFCVVPNYVTLLITSALNGVASRYTARSMGINGVVVWLASEAKNNRLLYVYYCSAGVLAHRE